MIKKNKNYVDTILMYYNKEMCMKAIEYVREGKLPSKLGFDIANRHFIKANRLYINLVKKGVIKPSVELVNALGELMIYTMSIKK